MALDLTGIANVNEFYSHHYLDALLESDLKGLLSRWEAGEEEDNRIPPYRLLSRCAEDYFKAKARVADTVHDGRHWLFYLAEIKSAYESHADLWAGMNAGARRAKAAHAHYLGDVFQPKSPPPTSDARFSPSRYITPRLHIHRWRGEDGWHDGWHNDISYHLAHRLGHPPLLMADPRRTFLWDEPMIYFAGGHGRNYLKWSSLRELSAKPRGTGP